MAYSRAVDAADAAELPSNEKGAPPPRDGPGEVPVSNALPLMPIPAAPSSATRRPLTGATSSDNRYAAPSGGLGRPLPFSTTVPRPAGGLAPLPRLVLPLPLAIPRTTPERMAVARERIRSGGRDAEIVCRRVREAAEHLYLVRRIGGDYRVYRRRVHTPDSLRA